MPTHTHTYIRLNYIFGPLTYLLFPIWSLIFKIFQSSPTCTPPLLHLVLSVICPLVMHTWPIPRGTYIREIFFFSFRFPPSLHFFHRVSFFLHISSSSIVFPSSLLLHPSFCLFQTQDNTNSNSFISLTKSTFEIESQIESEDVKT